MKSLSPPVHSAFKAGQQADSATKNRFGNLDQLLAYLTRQQALDGEFYFPGFTLSEFNAPSYTGNGVLIKLVDETGEAFAHLTIKNCRRFADMAPEKRVYLAKILKLSVSGKLDPKLLA